MTAMLSPRRAKAEQGILALSAALLIVAIAGFVLVPIVISILLSFSDAKLLRFPITAWSLRWYEDFFGSGQFTDALRNSLEIAAGTMIVSTKTGTMAAWAVARGNLRGSRVLSMLLMLPLFMPGAVLGLGIAIGFGKVTILGWPLFGSRPLIIFAHSLWSMPLVFMLMDGAFRALDREQIEAAGDLGASRARTFFEIALPGVSVALLSSALFSFVISLNEFYMSLFLSTRDTQTLPVLMWLSLRSAGTPRLAVASVVLLFIVLAALLALWLLTRWRGSARRR